MQESEKNLQQAYRTSYLVACFLRKSLTQDELEELDDWIMESKENMRLFGELTDEKNIARTLAAFEKINVEKDLASVKKQLRFNPPRSSRRRWQYAVAASVILALGAYLLITQFSSLKKKDDMVVVTTTDINPGGNEATLTLENGTVIPLGSSHDTIINQQVKVLGDSGELVYAKSDAVLSTGYHTLTIPRKGHYKIILPDGTRVWLNSESSIRYPVAFAETERKVFVTGETYFEVAKDKHKPFRAVADGMTVEALGTQFNINAYPNEPFAAASLIEGSVLVSGGHRDNILQPGQQAQISGEIFIIASIDPKEITGWKNDAFVFVNTPLASILRQAERWYDAEIVYKDIINIHLNATIDRSVPVSRLMQRLEATGQVHFKVEGKKIYVSK
jgi:transmembrane sensor